MTRKVEIGSLALYIHLNACAHSCRYCNMAEKKLDNVPRERFAKILEQFINWRDRARPGFRLAIGELYSGEQTLEALKLMEGLRHRMGPGLGRMHLGGLKIRSEPETRDWLQQRFDLGTRFANASYAGTFEVHDYWNRRRGDFQHLLCLQTIAAEIGMDLGQYMFVTRSTFPHLEELLDHLEMLPKPAIERALIPFSYIGWARDQEDERILEEHRDRLPDRLRTLMPKKEGWKSEREWMKMSMTDGTRKDLMLRLEVDETNIEYIETASCDEIVEDLEARTRAAYELTPTWEELRDRHGDKTNLRIYANQDDIERKWLDAYLKQYPIQIERRLTHLTNSF